MDETLQDRATERLEEALRATGAMDPRASYRAALRALKDARPDSFTAALRHYEDVLLPRVAADADPLAEWQAYGRRIAELSGTGRVVAVDGTGRMREAGAEPASGDLLLHLPDEPATPVLVLAGPAVPSAPQQATLDLLVMRRLGR